MADLAAWAGAFAEAGVGVAAISADPAPALATLASARQIGLPLLSDPECRVIREWGLFNPARGGIARPAVLWLDPGRRVRYAAPESLVKRLPARALVALVRGELTTVAPQPRRQWPRFRDWARALRAFRRG